MQSSGEDTVNDTPKKKKRKLQIPDGYKKIKSKLDLEGKPVFLFQAPNNLDITRLDGTQIKLEDGNLQCIGTSDSDRFEIEVQSSQENTITAVQSKGSVEGIVHVRKRMSLPSPIIPQVFAGKVAQPSGLKQRYIPFGADAKPKKLKATKVRQKVYI